MQQLEVINILKNDLNFTDQSIEKLKEFYLEFQEVFQEQKTSVMV